MGMENTTEWSHLARKIFAKGGECSCISSPFVILFSYSGLEVISNFQRHKRHHLWKTGSNMAEYNASCLLPRK